MEMKMNSSTQTLFLNPFGNFDISICIPGYDNSDFMPLKIEGEEDYQLFDKVEQENYIQQMFDMGSV